MFRRAAFSAVAALTVGVLAVGCNEDGDTIVSGASSIRPDAFPGSQVDVSNVADDGRALTPAGEAFRSGEMFWNSSNGEGILVFTTQNQNNGAGDTFNLYAAWLVNGAFRAPVHIRGNDTDAADRALEDAGTAPNGFKVMFLNPTGVANANAAARVGDAIILFTRNDRDLTTSVASSEEDENRRLWAAYADRSEIDATAANGVIRGIQTNAQVIDTDNQFTGVLPGGQDPSVSQFGFSSDSLEYTHQCTDQTNGVQSGQPTSYVHIWYGKQTGSATATAPAIRVVTFDITQTGNAFPASSAGTNLPFVGVTPQASTGADLAGAPVLVHNNVVIWSATNVNVTDNDDVVIASVLPTTATGGTATSVLLGSDLTANANDQTLMPNARDLYGPDHGVNGILAFFLENNFSDGATAGNRHPDTDAMAAFLTLSGTPSREIREVDLFTNALGTGISAARGSVASIQGTRINRSGDYVTILMLQDNNNTEGAAILVNDVLVVNVVQVRKVGTTSTRTLANSVGTPVVAPSLGFPAPTTGTVEGNVFAVQFQQDLAQGRAPANGGGIANRGCSFQGNTNRMNFLYQQRDSQQAVPSSDDVRLFVNGIRVTPGTTDATAPTFALTSSTSVIVETLDVNYLAGVPTADTGFNAIAIDAGDDSRTTATPPLPTDASGRPLIFFVSNETKSDFVTAGNPAGSFVELRLFASDNGAVGTVISTNPSTSTLDAFQVANATPRAISVPVNEDTTNNPSWAGTTAHVFWTEASTAYEVSDLGTRSYALDKSEGTTTPFAERFTPVLTAEPVFIDNPADRPLLGGPQPGGVAAPTVALGYAGLTVVRNGSTVGVFFDEDQRLYYQQTSGSANDWYKIGGVSDPQLVDNESDRPVLGYSIASPPRCNNLSGTLAIFQKSTDTASAYPRNQVRELD